MIDSLVWSNINYSHLASTFQGISNFKMILLTETKEELEFSLHGSRDLIEQLDTCLKENHNWSGQEERARSKELS